MTESIMIMSVCDDDDWLVATVDIDFDANKSRPLSHHRYKNHAKPTYR